MFNKQNQGKTSPELQPDAQATQQSTAQTIDQETAAQPAIEPSPLIDDPMVRHEETNLDQMTGSENEDRKLSKLRVAALRRAMKMPTSDT